MSPLAVVKHLDVIEQVSLGFLPCRVDLPPYPLLLQRTEERLRYRIVPAVTPTAHAGL